MLIPPSLPSLFTSNPERSQPPSEPSSPILFSPTVKSRTPSSSSSAYHADRQTFVSFFKLAGSTQPEARKEEDRERWEDNGTTKDNRGALMNNGKNGTGVEMREEKNENSDEDSKGRTAARTSTISVILSICLYSCGSLAIVFLNRKIFKESFQFPIFVSWLQQVVGLSAFQFFAFLSPRISLLAPIRPLFPSVSIRWTHIRAVLPLSLAFVGMIGFSNVCLKYVQISTYQVARAMTLLLNLILSYFILGTSVSFRAGFACAIVMSGFVIGSMDPQTLGLIGVCTGGMASLFQAFYMVQIKSALVHLNDDQNILLSYNLLLSSFIFFPVIFLAGEGGFVNELPLSPTDPLFFSTWSLLIASGLMGILLTMSTYWCVRETSPVTYNIVGYAKACLQSVAAIVMLGDIVTARSLLGIFLTLAGSFYYSRTKMAEMKEPSELKMARVAPVAEGEEKAGGNNGCGQRRSITSVP
eukprot:GHVS01077481.1.p1 GENE.GHVS01077481.1~~GHVS01077481.1.p1  ORF type:complete len:470 (-),score=41.88 GHVS01077481.1:413-1822(-)